MKPADALAANAHRVSACLILTHDPALIKVLDSVGLLMYTSSLLFITFVFLVIF